MKRNMKQMIDYLSALPKIKEKYVLSSNNKNYIRR